MDQAELNSMLREKLAGMSEEEIEKTLAGFSAFVDSKTAKESEQNAPASENDAPIKNTVEGGEKTSSEKDESSGVKNEADEADKKSSSSPAAAALLFCSAALIYVVTLAFAVCFIFGIVIFVTLLVKGSVMSALLFGGAGLLSAGITLFLLTAGIAVTKLAIKTAKHDGSSKTPTSDGKERVQ
ncbi:MAG: hypothetical protein K6F09_00360 [Clostridiales bacterium]|nr:hypothetical protein [Clostridiales bacterium]